MLLGLRTDTYDLFTLPFLGREEPLATSTAKHSSFERRGVSVVDSVALKPSNKVSKAVYFNNTIYCNSHYRFVSFQVALAALQVGIRRFSNFVFESELGRLWDVPYGPGTAQQGK